jgi:hypothetical protein
MGTAYLSRDEDKSGDKKIVPHRAPECPQIGIPAVLFSANLCRVCVPAEVTGGSGLGRGRGLLRNKGERLGVPSSVPWEGLWKPHVKKDWVS